MDHASRHDYDIGLAVSVFRQHVSQVVEVLGVAHGDQYVAGPHLHGLGVQLFLRLNAELLQLRLALACCPVRASFPEIVSTKKKTTLKLTPGDRRQSAW